MMANYKVAVSGDDAQDEASVLSTPISEWAPPDVAAWFRLRGFDAAYAEAALVEGVDGADLLCLLDDGGSDDDVCDRILARCGVRGMRAALRVTKAVELDVQSQQQHHNDPTKPNAQTQTNAQTVAGLFAYGFAAAALTFGLYAAPNAVLFLGNEDTLTEDGRFESRGWYRFGFSAVFYFIYLPLWLSLIFTALYGGRAVAPDAPSKAPDAPNASEPSEPPPWRAPAFPGRALWKDARFAVPYALGAAAALTLRAPPIYTVAGDEPATSRRQYVFSTLSIAIYIGGCATALARGGRSGRGAFPWTFARTGLRYLCATAVVYAPIRVGKVVQRIFALDSATEMAAATLVLWPCVREIGTMIVRKACFELSDHNEDADQAMVLVIHAFGALTTRFLVLNMGSVEGVAGVVVGQALLELVLRQTITVRDRFVFVHVLRHTAAEADTRFGSVKYREHRARVVIGEMVSEYSCIFLAPAVVLLFEPYRLFHNYGYSPSEPVDVAGLLLGTALQLGAEVLVDLLCVRVEDREGIPVLDEWRRSGAAGVITEGNDGTRQKKAGEGGRRRIVYLWCLTVGISQSLYLMSSTFRFQMPQACLPRPCHQCMAAGGVGAGPDLAGHGSAAEIAEWCAVHLPGVGNDELTSE